MAAKKLNKTDQTLLREAGYGHPVLVKQALNDGANVNAKEKKTEKTALILAAEKGERVVVETLLEMRSGDIQVDLTDQFGMTALHYAASNNHLEVIRILLDADADVDISNAMGATPLHEAAARGRAGALKMLCKAGANTHIPDKTGKNPYEVAMTFKKTSSAKVLKKAMDGHYAPKIKFTPPEGKRKSDASGDGSSDNKKKKKHPKNATMIRKNTQGDELSEIVDEMDREAKISDEVENLTKQVASLQERISGLQADKAELQSQMADNTPQEVRNLRTKIKQLKADMMEETKLMLDKDHELAKKEREISKWRQDNLKLKHQIEKAEKKNAEIVAHYEARLHDTTKSYSAVREEIKKRQESMSPEAAASLEKTISEDEALELQGRIDMLEKELDETRDTYEKTILEKNKELRTLQNALDLQLEEQKELQDEKMKMQRTYEQKLGNILSGYDGVRSALQEKHSQNPLPPPKLKSEPSQSTVRLKKKEKQFTKWLTEEVCLPQYLMNFANMEYNRMDIVSNMDDDDLKSVGISKKMHRVLIRNKIADYRRNAHTRTSSHIKTGSTSSADPSSPTQSP